MQRLIISSKVELYRNFKNKKFVNFMNDDELHENIEIVNNVVNENLEDYNLRLINIDEINDGIVSDLLEKKLITGEIIKRKDNTAVFVNDEESILVVVNENDHLKICSNSNDLNLKEEFECVNRIDDIIESRIEYAFSEKYGYLASEINRTGTGLKASVILHLPLLNSNKKIQAISKTLNKSGIVITKTYGNDIKEVSNLFQVTNKFRLGVNEGEVIEKLQNAVQELINSEIKLRDSLVVNGVEEIEDKVFRAEAILRNARILTVTEIMKLVSDVRMGVEMSLTDISSETLDKILLLTQDSKIEQNLPEPLTDRKKNMMRAQIVKEILG